MRGRALRVAVLMMLAGCGGGSSTTSTSTTTGTPTSTTTSPCFTGDTDCWAERWFPPAIHTAVERAGLVPMTEPSAHRYTAPDTEACEQDSGAETCQFGDIAPHWVVDSVCREGGYDPPAAGQPFTEWSFTVEVPWADEVRAAEGDEVFKDEMKAVVLADNETAVQCVLLVFTDDDPDLLSGYVPGVWAAPPRT